MNAPAADARRFVTIAQLRELWEQLPIPDRAPFAQVEILLGGDAGSSEIVMASYRKDARTIRTVVELRTSAEPHS